MRSYRFIFVLIILFIFISGVLLWKYAGFGSYIRALQSIKALPQELQTEATKNFINSGEQYLYGGILAGTTKHILPGVWVWGRKGLRYFRTDNYSVYSFFRVCAKSGLNSQKDTSIQIGRSIDTNLTEWSKKTSPGQFVVIMITSPENGGTLGNLREAKAHDWWAFLPANVPILCEK
jgi:hypothetical protein